MLDVRERNAYKIPLNKDEGEGLFEKCGTDAKITAQERQRTFNVNTKEWLCNHCCCAKAISIKYSGCVFVALGTQHTKNTHAI